MIDSNREGYNSPEYKAWRYAVFARDNWTCQMTGAKGELEAHHIVPWAKAPHLRYAVSNGITLSKDAHALVTGREQEYEDQFRRLIATKKFEAKAARGAKKTGRTKEDKKTKWRPSNPRFRL